MSHKRVLIITNSGVSETSLIKWLGECWMDLGCRVHVVSDLNSRIDADIAFLHVDMTNVSSDVLEFSKRYPVVINGRTVSISKEIFSDQMLEKNKKYTGKVIVKTKENYGGMPELNGGNFPNFKRRAAALTRKLALSESIKIRIMKYYLWRHVSALDPKKYPVFGSQADVPTGVWGNPKLMVEKFLPELDEEGRYILRHWYFFGDKEFSRTLLSKNSIVKWSCMNEMERESSSKEWWDVNVVSKADIPSDVRKVRKSLGMDFGRIDWVMHHGKPIVFDANKTPDLGARSLKTDLDRKRKALICGFSEGLEYFMKLS